MWGRSGKTHVEELDHLEEEVHAAASEEPLTVDRSLVGHVPHRRPGCLHHVVADTRLGQE